MSYDGFAGEKAVVRAEAMASIHRVLRSNATHGSLSASSQEDLSELHRRLVRVKGFGAAFEGIGFSPDVRALMRKAGIGEKARI